MDFRIRQLQCFLTLAELLHYGRTARALYMSQPTITFQIKSLEQAFGVALFERDRQQVHLTAAGLAFRSYAQSIVDTVTEARQHLGDLHSRLQLKITCGPIGQAVLLPAVLLALAREYPGFALEVDEMTTEQQMINLPEGKVDALLMVAPLPLKGVRFDCLREEPLVAIVPRQSPLAQRRRISVEDLRNQNIIAPRLKDCSVRQPFLQSLLAPYGITPHFLEAPHSRSAQVAYVAAGKGLMIGTRLTPWSRTSDVVIRPFKEALPRLQLGLASMNHNASPAMIAFRNLVLACAREKKQPTAIRPVLLAATA